MIREYLLKKLTGKTKYQRSKKQWFDKGVFRFKSSERGGGSSTIKYSKENGISLTYYGSRNSVSQFIEFLYNKSTSDCFFMSKYESMLKDPKISFSYELVVDYEQRIFDELTTQEKRNRSLEKLGI